MEHLIVILNIHVRKLHKVFAYDVFRTLYLGWKWIQINIIFQIFLNSHALILFWQNNIAFLMKI